MKSVRGTRDLIGDAYEKYSYFSSIYREHMINYGFKGVEPPILEHKSLFTSQLGESSDVVSKEMYLVNSVTALDNEQTISYDTILRPEGTIPCIRSVFAAGMIDEINLRLFYYGPMFRYSRPQKGRFRQFSQFGCECLNVDDPYIDSELIECIVKLLKSVGASFTLHINTLGSDGAMDEYKKVLYQYLKENKEHLNELNQKRLDVNVMRVLDQLNDEEKQSLANMPNIVDYLNIQDQDRFSIVRNLLDRSAIQYLIDPYLVRGLDYYKQTVFELVVDGMSIAGGGCYKFDRSKFIGGKSGKEVNGIGWAIGYERIEEMIQLARTDTTNLLIHGDDKDFAYQLAQYLRDNKIQCTVIYGLDKNVLKKSKHLGATHIITCDTGMLGRFKVKKFDQEWVDTKEGLLKKLS